MTDPIYRIYWLVSAPHCERSKQVKQVGGTIAYVCKHIFAPVERISIRRMR